MLFFFPPPPKKGHRTPSTATFLTLSESSASILTLNLMSVFRLHSWQTYGHSVNQTQAYPIFYPCLDLLIYYQQGVCLLGCNYLHHQHSQMYNTLPQSFQTLFLIDRSILFTGVLPSLLYTVLPILALQQKKDKRELSLPTELEEMPTAPGKGQVCLLCYPSWQRRKCFNFLDVTFCGCLLCGRAFLHSKKVPQEDPMVDEMPATFPHSTASSCMAYTGESLLLFTFSNNV